LGRAAAGANTPAEASVLAGGHLLRLGDDAGRAAIIAGLKSRKGHVRALAVEQLAAHGGAWAKQPLEKLARSGKGADLGTLIAGALRAIAERSEASGANG
jgi:hypothetical protein